MLPVESVLMDLSLLGSDERALVDIRMDFNIRVVRELEGVLRLVNAFGLVK